IITALVNYASGLAILVGADDVGRLQTFCAFFDVEFDGIAFIQAAIAVARILNRRIVHKEVFAPVSGGDETIALAVVEPLDGAVFALIHGVNSLSIMSEKR